MLILLGYVFYINIPFILMVPPFSSIDHLLIKCATFDTQSCPRVISPSQSYSEKKLTKSFSIYVTILDGFCWASWNIQIKALNLSWQVCNIFWQNQWTIFSTKIILIVFFSVIFILSDFFSVIFIWSVVKLRYAKVGEPRQLKTL